MKSTKIPLWIKIYVAVVAIVAAALLSYSAGSVNRVPDLHPYKPIAEVTYDAPR